MKTVLTLVVVLGSACGGKAAPATSSTASAHPAAPAAAGEHANMGPEMAKFHDVLAPRWHAEKGPQRMTDTCAAVPDFQSNAAALAASSPPPSAEAASWKTATGELTAAVAALDGACKANAAEFETAFERVHTVFHAVMELGEGGHGHAM